MKQLKAYKFRIYPSEEQKIFFSKTFGCVRLVYNLMLNDRIKAYEESKRAGRLTGSFEGSINN